MRCADVDTGPWDQHVMLLMHTLFLFSLPLFSRQCLADVSSPLTMVRDEGTCRWRQMKAPTIAWMTCGSKYHIKISSWTTVVFNSIIFFKVKMKNRHDTWKFWCWLKIEKTSKKNRKQTFYMPPTSNFRSTQLYQWWSHVIWFTHLASPSQVSGQDL